jgi:hypothetical protein
MFSLIALLNEVNKELKRRNGVAMSLAGPEEYLLQY